MSSPGKRSRLPERLRETVEVELDRLGGAREGSAGITAVARAWPQAVGETIARHAWPSRLTRDGTLVVNTSSSTWAFELKHLESAVLGHLGKLAPPRLSFVVGPIPEAGADSVADAQRSTRPTTRPEQAEGARIAAAIEDEELRRVVARAASASLARARSTGVAADPSDTLKSP